jgi:hypothetical protein
MARKLALTLLALLIVALLIGVVVAFTGADTSLMRSNTSSESMGKSYTVGTRTGENVAVGKQLAVYVAGDGPVAESLRSLLPRRLIRDEAFSAIAPLDTMPDKVNAPVLIVDLETSDVRWMPLSAGAEITARVSYATDGDTAWHDEERPTIVGAADPIRRVRIESTLTDSSSGLVPRKAYHNHLAESLADEIVTALAEELTVEEES